MPTRTFTIPNRSFPLRPEWQALTRLSAATYQLTISGTLAWDDVAGVPTNVSIAIDIDCDEQPWLNLPYFRFYRQYVPTVSQAVSEPFSFTDSFVLPARLTLRAMVLSQPPLRVVGSNPAERIFGPAEVRITSGQVVLVS